MAIGELFAYRIPDGLTFLDLELKLHPTLGTVSFKKQVIKKILKASGEPTTITEVVAYPIILGWYDQHLAKGGKQILAAELLRKSWDALMIAATGETLKSPTAH